MYFLARRNNLKVSFIGVIKSRDNIWRRKDIAVTSWSTMSTPRDPARWSS